MFRQYWQMSIRNQVHATIIFMSLLSFIVVGVAPFFSLSTGIIITTGKTLAVPYR